jgi:hypothetical protein
MIENQMIPLKSADLPSLPSAGACSRCRSRHSRFSNVVCAFDSSERIFSTENWNCATMNVLRRIAAAGHVSRNGDISSALISGSSWLEEALDAFPGINAGHFVSLVWYKERGRTTQAFVLDEERGVLPLTERIADAYIRGCAKHITGEP